MRVRIVRPVGGVVDRVSLSSLIPGFVYDLHEEFAAQLIEMRVAVVVGDKDTPTIDSLEDVDIAWLTGGVHIVQPDTAYDRPPRRVKRPH